MKYFDRYKDLYEQLTDIDNEIITDAQKWIYQVLTKKLV
jgi:hypothetical protein